MINAIWYCFLSGGISLVFWEDFCYLASLLRPSNNLNRHEVPLISAFEQSVKRLFQVAHPEWSGQRLSGAWAFFLIISAGSCLGSGWLLVQQEYGIWAIIVGIVLGMVPWGYLRVTVAGRQITGSYEGQTLLAEFLNQYKMNHHNAIVALEKSMPYLAKAPISRGLLYQLTLRLKTYQTDVDLRGFLDDFAVQSNTQWANMLSTNLYYAISMDTDITLGLTDLLQECTYTQKLIEQSKRQNNEAFVMMQMFCPVIYIILMWSLSAYFDLTVGDIIHYQLFSEIGVALFLLMLVGGCIGLIVAKMAARPKFDI